MSAQPRYKGRASRYCCPSDLGGARRPGVRCQATALQAPLGAAILAEVVALADALATAEVDHALRRHWNMLARSATTDAAGRVKVLEREAAQARERLVGATEMYVDRKLDKDGYDGMCAKARAALEAAEAEASRLRAERPAVALPPVDEVLRAVAGWVGAFSGADIGPRRDALAAFVEAVTPERVTFGKYRAHVAWTPPGRALREAIRATEAAA